MTPRRHAAEPSASRSPDDPPRDRPGPGTGTPSGGAEPGRQERRKAETRGRLIDAAAELFAHNGYHAVSAEAVADAAGRTTGALYSHFGGKEGLLLALLEVWKERTAQDLTAEMAASADREDPSVHHSAMWRSLTRPHPERGDSWLLLEAELWLHGARGPLVGTRLADRYAEVRARLGEGHAERSQAAGTPPARPPQETGALILGLLLGLAMQHRLDPRAVPDSLVVDALGVLLAAPAPAPDVPTPPKPRNFRNSRNSRRDVDA
ncbi:TetR/AcrR family transcriptional regulator [Streptomyces sp. NPDC057939]|uniref:TetR/AcrR family transcriptional regulator n=1 Tax=Streptomyces sp. NPDC057939 TaxID=3346284 RepID=UPI0036DFB470